MNLDIREQEEGERLVLVALADGEPAGRVTLDFAARRPGGGTLFRLAWVDPDLRSRGIGTALVRRAEEVARGRGYPALDCLVRLDNPRALALYRRLGYEVVGPEVNRYRSDAGDWVEEDCTALRRRL